MDSANQAKHRTQRLWLRATTAGLLCALLALVAGTVLFARQTAETQELSARQADLNIRLRQLHTMLVTLGDAETGQRGYLLTGKEQYLAPYSAAVSLMPELLQSLDHIPAELPQLNTHIALVREFMGLKFAELERTIQLYRQGQHDAALQMVQSGTGMVYMEQTRSHISAVLELLRSHRDDLNLRVAAGSDSSRRLAILIVSTLVAFILLAAAQIVMLARSRLRYERALTESEMQHRAIVEEQTEMVSLAQEDGTLTYVNPAYARHFNLSSSQMVGTNLYDRVDVADRDAVRAQLTAVLQNNETRQGENRMLAADGGERWFAWTNRCQRGSQGEKLLHSVGRDITERKKAAEALRASEDFLARTGRLAGVGGWEVDLVTHAVHWSEQVKRIHEVPPDFMPTLQSAIAFYTPAAQDKVRSVILESTKTGKPWDLELPLTTAKGRQIYVRTIGETEFDADGEARRLVGAFQDITERKALEQQLAESERFVREITDHLPVRIAYLDRERRFRFMNTVNCKRFKRAHEDIIGHTRSELVGDGMDAIFAPRALAALQGELQRFEFEEQVDGELRQIEGQMIPHFGEDGAVLGFFTTGIDITERKAAERALRDLTEIFDHTTDYIVQTDWRGNIHYLNPSVRRVLGLAPDTPIQGLLFSDFNTPETNALFANEIHAAVRQNGVWVGEATVYAEGRRVVPVNHMTIAHHDASGRIARYSAVMRDISANVAARNQLQLQSATLQAVVESIPAMVAVFGADLRYRLVNTAFERWKGLARDSVVGHTAEEILGPAEYQRSLPWALRALAGETVSYEKEYPGSGQSRYLAFSYIPLRLADGTVDGFIGVAQDITPHREEEIRLLYLSERDALTGLLNRAGFESYLTRKIQAGNASTLALLYIDLDHFKPVNDSHGHPVGDALLRLFAERLQRLVRPTDAVARLGGDEFAVVLSGVRERSNADWVADKVIEAAQTPFEVTGFTLHIGASVGVAFDASGAPGWQGLVERADAMLYAAKAAGRGRKA
ncbi:PAS domain S-box protein [Rhodoferax sp.]|uniref:PAS domain S-box protein n=1 Tax=Rhodoferax sp. TaxID=50421 RepID=UPI00374D620C